MNAVSQVVQNQCGKVCRKITGLCGRILCFLNISKTSSTGPDEGDMPIQIRIDPADQKNVSAAAHSYRREANQPMVPWDTWGTVAANQKKDKAEEDEIAEPDYFRDLEPKVTRTQKHYLGNSKDHHNQTEASIRQDPMTGFSARFSLGNDDVEKRVRPGLADWDDEGESDTANQNGGCWEEEIDQDSLDWATASKQVLKDKREARRQTRPARNSSRP